MTSSPPSFVELHEYLRQQISPELIMSRGDSEFARVEAYWHIGRIIVETEQQGQDRAEYGLHLIEQLANELTQAYGKGYKTSNLWWFRQFYVSFPTLHSVRGEFVGLRDHLRTELTWTHYRILISVADQSERHFYLHTAADESWSTRTLSRLVKSRYYYQVALGQDHLRAETVERRIPEAERRRSRIAQARRALQVRPGWSVVDRTASGLPLAEPKPDGLFYHFVLQRFIGLWVLEPESATSESIRRQLAAWKAAQPKEISGYPLALLLTQTNRVQLLTTAETPPLSEAHRQQLPTHL